MNEQDKGKIGRDLIGAIEEFFNSDCKVKDLDSKTVSELNWIVGNSLNHILEKQEYFPDMGEDMFGDAVLRFFGKTVISFSRFKDHEYISASFENILWKYSSPIWKMYHENDEVSISEVKKYVKSLENTEDK